MSLITTRCPPFEYATVSGVATALATRSAATLIHLRSRSPEETLAICADTRPLHKQYFAGLTPVGFDYYAGNYRGSNFFCLKEYRVHIAGDPIVGHPPDRIYDDMRVFADDFRNVVRESDFLWAVNPLVVSQAEKLYRLVQLGVALFVYFLQIHPYADGNGHMARFFLIGFLSRFGVFPSKWPLHPRPQDPPYSQLISQYRRGDRGSLEHFVLACI